MGRWIDTVYLFDPVTRYYAQKWKSLQRGQVYEVPPNVRRVVSIRQVNKRTIKEPVGQRPVASSPHTKIEPELVLGSLENLKRYAQDVPAACRLVSDEADHYTIDGLPEVQDYVVRDLIARVPLLEPSQ